jgi:membrane protein
MLYIALTVAGIFIDEWAMVDRLFARLAATLGQETAQFVQEIIINASERVAGGTILTTLISLGVLLYAATGLFAQLKYSLNTIWHAPPPTGWGIWDFVKTRLLAFGLVLGVGLILIVATFVSFIASILTNFFDFGGQMVAGNVISFVALLGLSFAILYRILPDVEVTWREVWPGALLAAALMAVGRWGLGFYLSHTSIGSAFEAAGTLAIMLIAIYYSAQIFLFGAVFTKVYATNLSLRSQGKSSEPL